MKRAPSAKSQSSGKGAGEPGLAEIDDQGAQNGARQRAAAATATQMTDSMEFGGRELARIDDADLRHVERPPMPAMTADSTQTTNLYDSGR